MKAKEKYVPHCHLLHDSIQINTPMQFSHQKLLYIVCHNSLLSTSLTTSDRTHKKVLKKEEVNSIGFFKCLFYVTSMGSLHPQYSVAALSLPVTQEYLAVIPSLMAMYFHGCSNQVRRTRASHQKVMIESNLVQLLCDSRPNDTCIESKDIE